MGQSLSTFISWLSGTSTIQNIHPVHLDEKSPLYTNYTVTEKPTSPDDSTAAHLIDQIFTAPSLPVLHAQLRRTITAQNWTETLATAILTTLTKALETGIPMGQAVKEAYDKASADVETWARRNPKLAAVIVVIVALGILVVVMPWVVEWLGFEAVGPRLGEFAPGEAWGGEGRRGLTRSRLLCGEMAEFVRWCDAWRKLVRVSPADGDGWGTVGGDGDALRCRLGRFM